MSVLSTGFLELTCFDKFHDVTKMLILSGVGQSPLKRHT